MSPLIIGRLNGFFELVCDRNILKAKADKKTLTLKCEFDTI